METADELRERVASLEQRLRQYEQKDGPVRQKITEMSSEVVDSNPYRWVSGLPLEWMENHVDLRLWKLLM